MQIVLPNSKLVECFSDNVFESYDTVSKTIWQGIQIITATEFQNCIARKYGSEHLFAVNEFFRNFLGQFKQVAVDYLSCSIRLFNTSGDMGIEGCELRVSEHKVELFRLSYVCGTQVSTLVKFWQV